jgi:hypothetical protein
LILKQKFIQGSNYHLHQTYSIEDRQEDTNELVQQCIDNENGLHLLFNLMSNHFVLS